LSNFIFELLMLSASRPDLITQIKISHNVAVLTRGEGEISDDDFDISTSYLSRGRAFVPTL